ncbi:hypothetical protein V6N12_026388 [Hibiscus sabdariffa]|uniref:RNase H type-1 domain-containing protein n=1 Tax=Hibiscus sabdariffa TaxID=183260 RepID=A0ABR2DRM4_9ROSI
MHPLGYPKWSHHWLGREDRLTSLCLLTCAPRPLMVKDTIDEGDSWDWARLEQVLPAKNLEHIASIHPPCDSLGDDRPHWRWEPNCQFSSKSTYTFLSGDMNGGHTEMACKEWKVKIQHVNREGNRVTDRLATKGRAQRGLAATFSELPADVRELVDAKRIQSESDRDDLAEEGAIPHDPGGGPDAL